MTTSMTRSRRPTGMPDWYSPTDTRRSKRSKLVPQTPSSVGSSRSRSEPKRLSSRSSHEKIEQLIETPSRQSFSGTPSSGDDFDRLYNDMNDMRDELESIKAEQEQKNGKLTEELNQWKEVFKTIFEERFMTLSESIQAQNDERLKTLEERLDIADERLMISEQEIKRCNDNVSSLESKLNLIGAFVAAIVLFLIQANWTSLTHGFNYLVSLAGIVIDFVASTVALFQEFVISMAPLFRDYLVSKAANAVTSAAEVSGSKIGIHIIKSEM